VVEGVRPGQGQQDWDSGQERRAFTEMLEQIRFADSLGFDYAFLGEHHLMPEYAHNSATEVQLGVIAATTRNIRLGTGIVHASHNDPVRVAERVATIDQVSGGRAEFGFGPGSPLEIAPSLKDTAALGERSAAAAQIAGDIQSTRGVWPGTSGELFQNPHPPLWTSRSRPGMAAEVAAYWHTEHQAWRKKQLDGLNLPVVTSV
jgi:alkanesulfonate monooxygenase SsuD/methylene tetrahydromethanopterin reductase-like flavin-dependent oxidoreductase (luciferase family)